MTTFNTGFVLFPNLTQLATGRNAKAREAYRAVLQR
jgi:hypothetical protein